MAPGFAAPQLGWSIPGARREGPRRCRPPRNTRNWRRDLGSPGKTGARTPARLRVDAHHVALERPREGVRYLTCGAFCHRPFGDTLEVASHIPVFQNIMLMYGIAMELDARWLEAMRL